VIFFRQRQTQDLLRRLKASGLNMSEESESPKSGALQGLTFVITGTLENFTRKEIEKVITDRGGKTTGSVSKKTDYLLVGKNPGTKYDKAIELGIDIVTEDKIEGMF